LARYIAFWTARCSTLHLYVLGLSTDALT